MYNEYDERLKNYPKLDYYNYTNNNYNKPLYTEDANPNTVFDPYQGLIRGNLFKNLYNGYKLNKPIEIQPMNEQAELLTYLDAYNFATNDIALYLDIYPNDRDMIELFNKYRKEEEKMLKQYENKYGPLLRNSDANSRYPWAWDDKPWPWEQ